VIIPDEVNKLVRFPLREIIITC